MRLNHWALELTLLAGIAVFPLTAPRFYIPQGDAPASSGEQTFPVEDETRFPPPETPAPPPAPSLLAASFAVSPLRSGPADSPRAARSTPAASPGSAASSGTPASSDTPASSGAAGSSSPTGPSGSSGPVGSSSGPSGSFSPTGSSGTAGPSVQPGPAPAETGLKYIGLIRNAEDRDLLYIKDTETGRVMAVEAGEGSGGKYRVVSLSPELIILGADNLLYHLKRE